jgi:hypothetical protein
MKDAMRQSRKIRHSQDDEHQTYEGLRSVVEGGAAASIQTSASVRKILTGLSEFPAVKFQASTDAIRLWGRNPREKHIPAGRLSRRSSSSKSARLSDRRLALCPVKQMDADVLQRWVGDRCQRNHAQFS